MPISFINSKWVRTCSTYEGEEVLAGKSVGKRPFWDPGVGGRIILRWTLRKWGGGHGLD